jgi:hypothetical protein
MIARRELQVKVLSSPPHNVFAVDQMQECLWNSLKLQPSNIFSDETLREIAEEVKLFMSESFEFRPKNRLEPRASYSGGTNETLTYYFSVRENPEMKIVYVDKNSAYPHTCIIEDFPIGKPQILIDRSELAGITFQGPHKGCFLGKDKVQGIMHLTFIVPDMRRPFLQTKIKGRPVSATCRKCGTFASRSEKGVGPSNTKPCPHREPKDEKSLQFEGAYCITEISYALTLGYEIIRIHEAHIFTETYPIFKKFFLYLASERMKSSKMLLSCETESAKDSLCNEVNAAMSFPAGLCLRPEQIQFNPGINSFYKNVGVGFSGMLQTFFPFFSTLAYILFLVLLYEFNFFLQENGVKCETKLL